MARKPAAPKPVVDETKNEIVLDKPVISEIEPVIEKTPEPKASSKKTVDYSVFVGIGISMADYASQSDDQEAIKLLQKILGIEKTGDIEPDTLNSYLSAPSKFELIDDYNNMRKGTNGDLKDIRLASKKQLRDS